MNLLLAYHAHVGGWTDWLTHMAISAVVHAMIYSLVFRLLAHLSLGEEAVLVVGVLLVILLWGRGRDRRL